MTGHDTDPPPAAPATTPLPPDPPSEPAPVVRTGQARAAVLVELANVAASMVRLEALAVGIARALDATAVR